METRQVEEVRVTWNPDSKEAREKPLQPYQNGVDQKGRIVEINKSKEEKRFGSIHIDGELRYMGFPDPVAGLLRFRGFHSFVILENK